MASIQILNASMETEQSCYFLGVSRSTYYSWIGKRVKDSEKIRKPYTADHVITHSVRQEILSVMTTEDYMDKTPYEIFYNELDKGNYYCSVRTLYRILEENHLVRERRRGHQQSHYSKPELLAESPNEVWSWDITKLKGPRKWQFYYLYVILDIFSRYVVGWLIAQAERSELAKDLIEISCERQNITKKQLTIHSDRGASMTSLTVNQLLDNLSVKKSLSRPRVSNDNPYSESQFKTLKYRPEFPDRFGSIQDAREYCREFFKWYNEDHYHSGLNYLTPHSVHHGEADKRVKQRQNTMIDVYNRYPERFRNGVPKISGIPEKVWINKPEKNNNA